MPFLLLCNNRLLMNNGGKLLLRDTVPETEEDCPCYPSAPQESYRWKITIVIDSGELNPDYELTIAMTEVSISPIIYANVINDNINADSTTIEFYNSNNSNCYLIDEVKQTITPEPNNGTPYYTSPLRNSGGDLIIQPCILAYSRTLRSWQPSNQYARFTATHESIITFVDPVELEKLKQNIEIDKSGINDDACPDLKVTVSFTAID